MTKFKRGDLLEAQIRFGNGDLVNVCGYYIGRKASMNRTTLTSEWPRTKYFEHYIHDDMVVSVRKLGSAFVQVKK